MHYDFFNHECEARHCNQIPKTNCQKHVHVNYVKLYVSMIMAQPN